MPRDLGEVEAAQALDLRAVQVGQSVGIAARQPVDLAAHHVERVLLLHRRQRRVGIEDLVEQGRPGAGKADQEDRRGRAVGAGWSGRRRPGRDPVAGEALAEPGDQLGKEGAVDARAAAVRASRALPSAKACVGFGVAAEPVEDLGALEGGVAPSSRRRPRSSSRSSSRRSAILQPVLPAQDPRQGDGGAQVARRQRQRLLGRRQRLVEPVGPLQQGGERRRRLGVGRIECDGAPVAAPPPGRAGLAAPSASPQVAQRLRPVGAQRQRPIEAVNGVGGAVEQVQRPAAVAPGLGVVRRGPRPRGRRPGSPRPAAAAGPARCRGC